MIIRLRIEYELSPGEVQSSDVSFDKSEITIGREKGNDIELPLATISRHHARLYQQEQQWLVEDLHSSHGTNVNGNSIQEGGKRVLRNGDVISILHAKITVDLDEELAPVVETRQMIQEAVQDVESGKEAPYLLLMNGPKEGTSFRLSADAFEWVLGRSEESNIWLDDQSVSRKHARIRRDLGEWVIEDLQSKNGVLVNEAKITMPHHLKDADRLQLGALKLTYVDPAESVINQLEGMAAFASKPEKADKPEQEEKVIPAETSEPEHPLPQIEAVPKKPIKRVGAVEWILVALIVLVVGGLAAGVALILVSG